MAEIVTETRASGNIAPSTRTTPSSGANIPPETIQETKTTENKRTFYSQDDPVSNYDTTTYSEYLENRNFYADHNAQGYSYPTGYPDGSYQTNSESYTEATYVSVLKILLPKISLNFFSIFLFSCVYTSSNRMAKFQVNTVIILYCSSRTTITTTQNSTIKARRNKDKIILIGKQQLSLLFKKLLIRYVPKQNDPGMPLVISESVNQRF